ncbi:hypothetical protein [Micromonospora sp. LOL_023]|uniref:hypothetical protein n=1 Tax=Micromonospora sp. LOL_023 TaxID=3345418 RepID=UPI003A8BCF61
MCLPDADADPLETYLRQVTTGQPGGRILLQAAPPAAPSLATMVRLVHVLGLVVALSVADHRANAGAPHLVQGLRWGARVAPPEATTDLLRWVPGAHHRTVSRAVDRALRDLRNASDRAVPTDPYTAILTPTNNNTVGVDVGHPRDVLAGQDDPVLLLTTLAAKYPGVTLTVLLTPDRCKVQLPRESRPSAETNAGPRKVVFTAPTLAEAVAAAGSAPLEPADVPAAQGRNDDS